MPAPFDLNTPVMYLKGVGPRRSDDLAAKGILTAADLLFYPPFRYEDRSNVKPLNELAPGEMATAIVELRSLQTPRLQRRDLGLVEATFADSSSTTLTAKWFHAKYLQNILVPGLRLSLYGKVEFDTYRGELSMLHPEFELLRDDDEEEPGLHTGRIVPVYESAGKVNPRLLRSILKSLLDRLPLLPDPLPQPILDRLRLPALSLALHELHFPSSGTDLRLLNNFRTPAQQRLILEEFFWLEAGMILKRNQTRAETGIAFELNEKVRERIKAMLPFKPTGAQKRVLGEIAQDMAAPRPMSRLLQGDVGSGKTIVAAEAAVIAVENGYQAALLAPTEILATQHYLNLKRVFAPLGYNVAPLVGSMSKKEKELAKRALAAGLVHVAVGTHALLEDDVEFARLGLAIIDEQHRFGVLQRKRLLQKGVSPDVLVMTATPIPRTLALTVYGDLDVSTIDELPPGRKPIETTHRAQVEEEQVYSFILGELRAGRQAYIVYPAIEETEASERTAMKAAQAAHQHLSQNVFPAWNVGLLHGKLPSDEKEATMNAFQRGEIHVLVSTTVIEVGVDVPNSSVMVIENAERFGLAQIHQLRGRVGRGAAQSYCILVTAKLSEAGRERIRTLVSSSDGFHIAEMDLRLRGPGEFLGTRQSGIPTFRLGNLLRDRELLELARAEALAFFDHPSSAEDLQTAIQYVKEHWQHRFGLALIG